MQGDSNVRIPAPCVGRDHYVRILYARSLVKDSVRIRDPDVRTLYVEIDMYELHLRGYRYVKILYVESPCKDSVWGVLMKGFLSVHRLQGAPHKKSIVESPGKNFFCVELLIGSPT